MRKEMIELEDVRREEVDEWGTCGSLLTLSDCWLPGRSAVKKAGTRVGVEGKAG